MKISTLLYTFSVSFLFSANLNAQQYVNGSLSTGSVTLSGLEAPSGYTWSELQHDPQNPTVTNVQDGNWIGHTFKNKMADDFVVPAGEIWQLNNFEFYIFRQYTATSAVPINQLRIEIWNGDPSLSSSAVIYGDLTTNVLDLENSGDSYMFNIKNTLINIPGGNTPSTLSKIWRIRGNVDVLLTQGTYWVVFQPVKTTSNTDILVCINKIAGSRGYPTNSRGKFLDTSPGNPWFNIYDPGFPYSPGTERPQDYAFNINYDLTLSTPTNSLQNFKLHPNPISDVLQIEGITTQQVPTSVEIFSMHGVKILRGDLEYGQQSGYALNLSSLASGIYIVRILSSDNSVIQQSKIVKD